MTRGPGRAVYTARLGSPKQTSWCSLTSWSRVQSSRGYPATLELGHSVRHPDKLPTPKVPPLPSLGAKAVLLQGPPWFSAALGGMLTQTQGLRLWAKQDFSSSIQGLKWQRKLRVKSPSTGDLPDLPSALSRCWPFSQALLPSLMLNLPLLRRPQSGVGGQCEGERKSQPIFPHFSPKCVLTGAAGFPGCNRFGRRWSWTEIRLKSGRMALFTKFLTYHRSRSTPGQLEFSVASFLHGLQKKRFCFSAIFLHKNQGEGGAGAMFWPQGCGTF